MMSVSKNVYTDKLHNRVDRYNNTYHSTIKIKPGNVKSSTYIDSSKEINNKFKMMQLEYQNIKTFLQKAMFQIDLRKFL